jgi:hypothetical protein
MTLSKSTIEACEAKNFKVYTAKKETNKFGTWITCIYAVKLNETTVTTEKTATFEGKTQQDIVNYFCNN